MEGSVAFEFMELLPMKLSELNRLPEESASSRFLLCCGSRLWAEKMAQRRPFQNRVSLNSEAEQIWFGLSKSDWLEAFSHHPRIGEPDRLRATELAKEEQKGVCLASESTRKMLLEGNEQYETIFGFVFLVCAMDKTAEEIIHLLQRRLCHSPEKELEIAVKEQSKIMLLRLEKLFHDD